jgi:HK97 family phage prohead protease
MNSNITSQNKASSSQKGWIAGYGSFFNVLDQQRDRIAKGAFTKTLRAWNLSGKRPKMLWQHDPKQPIGIWTHLHEDNLGLYVKGRLALGVPKADEAYLLMGQGVIEGLSIGFRTIEAIRDPKHKGRLVLDIDLIEISLVTFGVNAKATARVIG